MTEPYWQSPTTGQRLYRFTNGRGASVVKQGNTFELAVTRITGPRSYWLDWQTPFGPPKDKLTEEQVQKHLAEIEDYPSTVEVQGGAGVEGFPETTAKGPPPGFGEGLKGMDWEAAIRLLSWFGDVGDANIHGEMAAVVATKLYRGFLLMPVESAKPSAGLLLEISTEILGSEPMTLSAISNLHDLLVLMPRKIVSEIHRLASDAITKAREDAFLEAVFLPSHALKMAGDFNQAVRRLTALEYQQIEIVEEALAKCYRHSADNRLQHSTITSFEVIEMVGSVASTLATSILIDGPPNE